MGGGRKRTDDVKKTVPVSVLRALDFRAADGALAAGGQDSTSPCALPMRAPFTALETADVREGMGVRIVVSDPPCVMNGRRQLGVLDRDLADAVRACLERATGSAVRWRPSTRSSALA